MKTIKTLSTKLTAFGYTFGTLSALNYGIAIYCAIAQPEGGENIFIPSGILGNFCAFLFYSSIEK